MRAQALAFFLLTLALSRAIQDSAARAVEVTVKQNDVVKLEWSSDRQMTIHLHGYDIEKQITPGATTEMTFTARATGRFMVEPHLAKLPSGGHEHGDVLVTIEVYP